MSEQMQHPFESIDLDESPEKISQGASRMMRSQKSDIQNLMATELAMATYSSNSLVKIRHILEALRMLSEPEQAILLGDQETMERATRYYTLTNAMIDLAKLDEHYAIIPFPFTISDSPKYLDFVTQIHKLPIQGWRFTTLDQYKRDLVLVVTSGQASYGFCLIIKEMFITAGMPFALWVLKKIFREYITPAAWRDAVSSVGSNENRLDKGKS